MLSKRKYLMILGLAYCLTATLFIGVTSSGNQIVASTTEYDPWVDLDDDGNITIFDVVKVCSRYGTEGTPVNKTALLYEVNATFTELQSRIDTCVSNTSLGFDVFQSGLLLHLPYGATQRDYTPDTNNILLWLDLDQDTPGNQTVVFVPEGATIIIKGQMQTWAPSPGVVEQDFFIYSWTPSWPPPEGYYYAIYSGGPGTYPGKIIPIDFSLTVPSKPGVYYLYYCSGAEGNMPNAVNKYTQPLWVPYAIITASSS